MSRLIVRSLVLLALLLFAGQYAVASRKAAPPAQDSAAVAQVEVLWNGIWWDATVLGERGSSLKVHYIGWESSWDEWVSPARYRRPNHQRLQRGVSGQRVEIQWRGGWWPGRILNARHGKFRITYDGYGPEWNEWVGAQRLRVFGKPNV